jgi:hypothetical protein
VSDDEARDAPPLDDAMPASLPSVAREEEPSITGIHGAGARFSMAYSQRPGASDARVAYGPPASQRWPSIAYCIFTALVLALVAVAYSGGSNSRLYVWVVEGDRGRPLPASILAAVMFVSGIGTVLRAHMRGVVVSSEGIEARYLLALGMPRMAIVNSCLKSQNCRD